MRIRSLPGAALLLAVVAGFTAAGENAGQNSDQRLSRIEAGSGAASSAGQPAGLDDAAPPRRPAPRSTRVLFIVAKDCDRCEQELARLRKPGGEFEAMQARGWKIGESPDNHVQIVDREDVPDFVRQLEIREYPTVACVGDRAIVRSFKGGCTTPLDAWTFGWLLKGENERPRTAVLEAARVKTTGSYPLRGNHWSVEGEWNPPQERVVSHLRGPNHVSQLAANWAIDTWSYEELRSLHDDLHERELASGVVSSSVSFTPRYQPAPRGADNFSAGRKMLGH